MIGCTVQGAHAGKEDRAVNRLQQSLLLTVIFVLYLSVRSGESCTDEMQR